MCPVFVLISSSDYKYRTLGSTIGKVSIQKLKGTKTNVDKNLIDTPTHTSVRVRTHMGRVIGLSVQMFTQCVKLLQD